MTRETKEKHISLLFSFSRQFLSVTTRHFLTRSKDGPTANHAGTVKHMDIRCYYSDHELFEDVINHAVNAHSDNELIIRVLTVNSQTGKRSYYGQIHCIVRDLVMSLFGEDTFHEILKACQLNEDEHFLVFKQYTDSTTFSLFDTVVEITKLPRDDMLKVFGTFFLTYCMKHGYDKVLTTMGADMVTFIQNLDSLHSLLSLSAYRGIVAPSFSCFEEADGTLKLHYYSSRPGFYPICIGLMEAVGKELFNQRAAVTVLSYGEEEIGHGRNMYHTVMKVEVTDLDGTSSRKRTNWALSAMDRRRNSRKPTSIPRDPGTDSAIRAEDMAKACPYHILVDQNMCIKECGDNIRTLARDVKPGKSFHEVATIVQPVMHQTLANIMKFINSVYVLDIHTKNDSSEPFLLKGQMVWLPYGGYLLFMGCPRIHTLEDLTKMKLFMGDIPLYFGTRELLLLNQQRFAEIEVAHKLDETTIELKKMSKALEEEKKKTESLLHEMLPSKIARQLTSGKGVKGERYKSCTVLFSDVVGFTVIASKYSAEEIINMLNDMYYRFDSRVECHDVYKVETIGDAYMAATGLPEIQVDHAERMADFAMDMIEESKCVISPATGKPIEIRVGMHSGEVIAGVIGLKKPRYDIYGDTVNTASRMESSSVPERIHVSTSSFEKLYPKGYKFKDRGQIEVKGKGLMKTYFLVGTLDRCLDQPEDKFSILPDIFDPKVTADPQRKKIVKLSAPPEPTNNFHAIVFRDKGASFGHDLPLYHPTTSQSPGPSQQLSAPKKAFLPRSLSPSTVLPADPPSLSGGIRDNAATFLKTKQRPPPPPLVANRNPSTLPRTDTPKDDTRRSHWRVFGCVLS